MGSDGYERTGEHDTPRRRLTGGGWLEVIAIGWCLAWPIQLALHLAGQMQKGWTDGIDRPFGEDFLNFWSGGRLALSDAAATLYDIHAYHAFQVRVVGGPIDLYHYSYPPTMALLSAPFGLLPYPAAWAVWQLLGWLAFALALRRFVPQGWLLLAFAWPAVFINASAGQAGAWIAAIVGWGLILLPRRPLVAGLLLSLLTVKPQLFWLVPVALLAGREWRALAGVAIGSVAIVALAAFCFGPEIWADYAARSALLKRVILEDGAGVWHRMISVFVLVRHLGASVTIAYAAQAGASLVVAALVARAWYRGTPGRTALLVTGVLAGSLYVSDYDCVMLAFPAAWLWRERALRGVAAIAALLPLTAAMLAMAAGTAMGAVLLWAVVLAVWRTDGRWGHPDR